MNESALFFIASALWCLVVNQAEKPFMSVFFSVFLLGTAITLFIKAVV